MGYQARTVTPPKRAPWAAAVLPSTRMRPRVASIRSAWKAGVRPKVPACSRPAWAAARLSATAFALPGKTRATARSTSAHSRRRSFATTPT